MRIIARLDVKNGNLVKTINLEGLRSLGIASEFALKYYNSGIDELFVADPVASLYRREPLFDVLNRLSTNIFVPLTIGGGIKDLDHARRLLENGADKVAINSHALRSPMLIEEIAKSTGSQSVAVSIQARKVDGEWYCFYNCGRDNSGVALRSWITELEKRGAGELIVTSVAREGTNEGLDAELLSEIFESISIPVSYSGGFGKLDHLSSLKDFRSLSGLCISGSFHYNRVTISDVKEELGRLGFAMRVQ